MPEETEPQDEDLQEAMLQHAAEHDPAEDVPFTITATDTATEQPPPADDPFGQLYTDMMQGIANNNQAAVDQNVAAMRQIAADREYQRALNTLGNYPTATEINQAARQPILHQRPVTTAVPVEPHPDTVGVKLTAEVLLGRSLLDMLRSAPGNATVRTMIGKHCRKSIPPEMKTVNEIIDWIEANVTLAPAVVQETARVQGRVLTPNPAWETVINRPVVDREIVLAVEVEETGTESGRATYHASTHQTFTSKWDRQEFRNAVDEVDDFDELMSRIREASMDDMHEHGDGPETSDVTYDQTETTDSDIEEDRITNRDHVVSVVTQLLVQMADSIEDPEEAADFREKFGL